MNDETQTNPFPPDKLFVPPPGYNDISGTTLGNYKLVRKLAQGGMGVIYEAFQINLDRKVAVKVLTPELASRPEFLARFEREAKSAAALNHPNIVQVHDFGFANGRHYIVMEFIEGENLSEYISKRGKIPVENALAIVEQAALALKAAAEKSIIHRDIKPSNLMVTRDGRVKVADMGLAKILTQDSELTMSSVSIGSPHFIAPEQAGDSKNADHRVDIYSLGVTLLFLVTGKHAYDGESPISVVLAHATKPLPSGAELGTELPPEIESLIKRMAAKNPNERYQNYDELLADLQLVRQGYLPTASPLTEEIQTEYAPENSSNKFIWAIAAGIVLLAVIGVMAFALSKKTSERSAAQNPTQPQITATPPAQPEQQAPSQPQVPPQQQNNFPPQQQPFQQEPQIGDNQNRPMALLVGALDANHDRMIDADEIANASAALKKLDKNGDEKLELPEYLTQVDLASGNFRQFRIYRALQPDINGVIQTDKIANAPAELRTLLRPGESSLQPADFGPIGPMQGQGAGGNFRGGPPPGQQGFGPQGGMQQPPPGQRPPPQQFGN